MNLFRDLTSALFEGKTLTDSKGHTAKLVNDKLVISNISNIDFDEDHWYIVPDPDITPQIGWINIYKDGIIGGIFKTKAEAKLAKVVLAVTHSDFINTTTIKMEYMK